MTMHRNLFAACFAFALAIAAAPLQAQSTGAKPTLYTYVATWAVARPQWGDMVKLDEFDRPVLDKLVADGTLVGYGAYTNLIHQEGEPTHGSWLTATSEGNLLKALEVIYAHPGSVSAPVQAASKHWDMILAEDIYNGKPGAAAGGYLTWSQWVVKPGEMSAYVELTKKVLVPVLEKLLADGSITSYGEMTEDYHTQKMGTVFDYVTVPDAASMDKVNKAFDEAFEKTPGFREAYRALTQSEGHRDYLTRMRYMVSK